MKQTFFILFFFANTISSYSQNRLAGSELSINGFRNPSIGAEYRYNEVSVHAGYYTTAFKKGEYTNFFKIGISTWFLPVDNKEIPSSFYVGTSYMRGLNHAYKKQDAIGVEAGFRWMIWKGLNFRIGVIGVKSKGHDFKINPTPGFSYSFKL